MGIDVHDLCLNCFIRHLAVMEARSHLRVSHQCDTTLSNCCQRGGGRLLSLQCKSSFSSSPRAPCRSFFRRTAGQIHTKGLLKAEKI